MRVTAVFNQVPYAFPSLVEAKEWYSRRFSATARIEVPVYKTGKMDKPVYHLAFHGVQVVALKERK